MAEFPALPLWTDAYLADTGHLTTLEHGAYLLLLMTMWRAGGTLPNDDRKLARFARLTAGQWRRVRPTIMEFFTEHENEITQGRLTAELTFVRRRSAAQSDNARAKYRKTNRRGPATGEPNGSQSGAPTPTPTEKKEKPTASPKKGTRLPDDWTLPRAWGEWALEQGMTRETIRLEAEKFRDYWHSVPGQRGVKLDWQATWRNWCRKAMEQAPQQRSKSRGQERFDRALAVGERWDARREAEREVADRQSEGSVVPLLPAGSIAGGGGDGHC